MLCSKVLILGAVVQQPSESCICCCLGMQADMLSGLSFAQAADSRKIVR